MYRQAAAYLLAITLAIPMSASAEQFSAGQILRCSIIAARWGQVLNVIGADAAERTKVESTVNALNQKFTDLFFDEYVTAHKADPVALKAEVARQTFIVQADEMYKSITELAKAGGSLLSYAAWFQENYAACSPEIAWVSANP